MVARGLAHACAVFAQGALTAFGAIVLWNNGGSTVVNGQAIGLLLAAASVVCLVLLDRAASRSATIDVLALTTGVESLRIALLATVVSGWIVTGSYFVGWLATYAAIVLFCGSIVSLIADVLGLRPGSAVVRSARLHQWVLATHVGALVASIAGLALTVPVHRGDLWLLAPLVYLVGASVLTGALVSGWLVPRRRTVG